MTKYFWKTVEHKWYVLRAGLSIGVPLWRLIVHDVSKFSRAEHKHYDRQFFGDKGEPAEFAKAWLHHQNRNDHHWEYWMTRSDHSHGGSRAVDGCLPMPFDCELEMVADWMGASKAYTGSWDMTIWLGNNLAKIKIHSDTMDDLVSIFFMIGYKVEFDRFADSCKVVKL